MTAIAAKSPEQLIDDEFIERMLEEIPRMLPPVTGYNTLADQFSHRQAYRRLLREKILARLKEG